MTELIMQVDAMKSGGRYTANDNDDKSQGARNNKHKAVDSVAGRGSVSGAGGTYLELKSNNRRWTHPQRCGFPWKRNQPFKTSVIKWDSSWPADKQAYYSACKVIQDAVVVKERAEKREPTKAKKIAALKKQLEDLE